jgi:hypothetical protein
MRRRRTALVVPRRLTHALIAAVAASACAPAPGHDAALDASTADAPVLVDTQPPTDVSSVDATDAGGAPADAPDCAFACLPRQAFVDGSVVNYVLYPDGFTDPDAVCDAPPPSDPRCILAA